MGWVVTTCKRTKLDRGLSALKSAPDRETPALHASGGHISAPMLHDFCTSIKGALWAAVTKRPMVKEHPDDHEYSRDEGCPDFGWDIPVGSGKRVQVLIG